MLRLLYISTARKKPDPSWIDALLRVSRRRNEEDGITGLLVAGGMRFMQVLEGPDAAVCATMARIRRDPAHDDLVELARDAVETRIFPHWSMGYLIGDAATGDAALAETVATLIRPIEDRTIRSYFMGFAKLHAG